MRSVYPKTSIVTQVAIAASIMVIFGIDLVDPRGVAIWVLYFVPMALASFAWSAQLPLLVAAICSVLLAAGYLVSPIPLDSSALYAPLNRSFGFGTMWVTAFIGRQFVIGRQSIRRQEWLKATQAALAVKMQGDQTLPDLGRNILASIANQLGAQVGAIYFAEGSSTFHRVAAYALDPNARSPERVRAGEGLVGEVARDNKLMHLARLPEKYLEVSSSVGRGTPEQLVIAPADIDGRVYAVLELGFFRALEPIELELFGVIGQGIASAIRTATYRSRQNELLNETQRQAEELQAQQEELRVQNEELEQQSSTLQQSQARLENQQSELEQINSQLEEQTQALLQQRDYLARAQTDLQRANTYKSEFLANMSHELRTPLNSSLILAKLLLDNREGNLTAEQVKFAQTIYSAGNDLLTLINDILDLSKIEVGKLEIRPEPIALPRLIDDLMDIFEPIAADKKLELSTVLEDGIVSTIHTDPTRLQQILRNLLSNALKFTEHGGVELRVRNLPGHSQSEHSIAFDVLDTGIGIAVDQHDVIFEAFRQADGTTNRKYGGTGLGLSISRDLARLLGGDLTVSSEPGRGSTFTLVLPERHVVPEGADKPSSRAQESSMRRARTTTGSRPHPYNDVVAKRPIAPQVAAAHDDRGKVAPGARSILIVEDDPAFTTILVDLAHELQFLALVADTAEEGLALAERYKPSAIVLDVGLPDRSGLSVLDALKHAPATRHIPVHMLSVSDYTQTALSMGAAGYAIKPVQREQLVDALKLLESKLTSKLRRVLVVEDDATLRESTCLLLAGDDVQTVAVGTAGEALEQLRGTTFDCMVLDLTLPDRSGLSLLEEMSQDGKHAFPPVIVYTGRSLSRDEEQTLRRFSSSIIIKGARSPERLLDEVTLFLHQVESELPPDRQRMLRDARHRESVFEGKRVLVVEDDVRNIFALSSVLEPKGAKIEIARNGREALDVLRDKPPVDLVLMDIMMPEMDGLEATRQIRMQPAHAKLPIIALTAKAMVDDRESCLAAGANDYIAKPLDVDKLLSLARVWINK
jgi:CheY-like chemotaxis protein/signal transduction histidine kinase